MNDNYLQLRKILFRGPEKETFLPFSSGINVICGASDTGKSFLAESIDFMLGGSKLREITELAHYAEIELDLVTSDGQNWRLQRSVTGGNFELIDLDDPASEVVVLKQKHIQGRTDNLSGFLLEQIGLLGKEILKSSVKATTQGLSFRNLARLTLVQEDEIQQKGSPFWSGQFTTKTSELATIKLLLTGLDDSAVIAVGESGINNDFHISLIDELLAELAAEIEDMGDERQELTSQLAHIENSIDSQRESLTTAQQKLDQLLQKRGVAFEERSKIQKRLDEISELLARFSLLHDHYVVDIDRLKSIQESGLIFMYLDVVPCPHCGANPDHQHLEKICDGDVDSIIISATAEMQKTQRLLAELNSTVTDLQSEANRLDNEYKDYDAVYQHLDKTIRETVAPEVNGYRYSYTELVDERASVQKSIDLFLRHDRLLDRKAKLNSAPSIKEEKNEVQIGIPESVAHRLSLKISSILKAWHFPGECHVSFDKDSSDFVIDGKPRGSRGKGLRAITHAAVSVALLEFCQENGLSHPGFLVLDSPLLAYYKPEGEDDTALQNTDLKEKFYDYLVKHHNADSQILIIENPHPPESMSGLIAMTIFTSNTKAGRFGLL
ncbi:AAA family ATPase [Serratia fonticola]|uniref:AAA family ATPase n=1 Tax=Serratia fonticola TaxID=47917 RepID=UPI001378BEEA|nr:AAA family ATPase [Serratia fonticola]NCG49723.1 AAA family ATPase [Serratia fonticola]